MGIVLVILAVIASAFEANLWRAELPDVTLAAVIALFLRVEPVPAMALGLLIGIIRDGIDPSTVWVTPFMFVTFAFFTAIARAFVNMSMRWIVFLHTFMLAIIYRVVICHIYRVPVGWFSLIISAILTAFITLLFNLKPVSK